MSLYCQSEFVIALMYFPKYSKSTASFQEDSGLFLGLQLNFSREYN